MVCCSTRLAFSFSCSWPLTAARSVFSTAISTRRLFASISSRVAFSLAFSSATSTLRSSMANSARSWSLSAWMSLSDIGMVASSLRVVSFTARFHSGGASMSASRHPKKKPSAPNINALIIEISAPRSSGPYGPWGLVPLGEHSSENSAPMRRNRSKGAILGLNEG